MKHVSVTQFNRVLFFLMVPAMMFIIPNGMATELCMLILSPGSEAILLTEDQHLLYKKTWVFRGNNEVETLSACEDLLKDATIPYGVYRWAYLRRITYYCVTRRESQALEIGRQWLREHPDDPINIYVWNELIHICATRGHDDFKPTVEDLEAVAEPIFRRYAPYDVRVVDAHMAYAGGLCQFGVRTGDADLYVRALNQLREADTILQQMLAMPSLRGPMDVEEYDILGRRESIASSILSATAMLENARAQEERRVQHETEKTVSDAWGGLLEKEK